MQIFEISENCTVHLPNLMAFRQTKLISKMFSLKFEWIEYDQNFYLRPVLMWYFQVMKMLMATVNKDRTKTRGQQNYHTITPDSDLSE